MQAVVGVVRQYRRMRSGSSRPCARSDIPGNRRISILSPQTSGERLCEPSRPPRPSSRASGGRSAASSGGAAGTAGGLAVASLALPGVGPVSRRRRDRAGPARRRSGRLGSARQLDDTLSKGLPGRRALRLPARLADGADHRGRDGGGRSRSPPRPRALMSTPGRRERRRRPRGMVDRSSRCRGSGVHAGGAAISGRTKRSTAHGFDAAFRLPGEAPPWDAARSMLRDRHGPASDEPAFRAGYERGRAHRARASVTIL